MRYTFAYLFLFVNVVICIFEDDGINASDEIGELQIGYKESVSRQTDNLDVSLIIQVYGGTAI